MEDNAQFLPSLDVVLSETRVALGRQFEQLSSLDMKLGILLGLSGVILAALLGFPLIGDGDLATRPLLVVAVTLVLVSLVFAMSGYRVTEYKDHPAPTKLREFYLMEEPQRTKLALVDYLCFVYDWNEKRIATKVKCTRASFGFVFVGALMIGATLLNNLL